HRSSLIAHPSSLIPHRSSPAMHFFSFIFKNIRRRPARSGLTASGIAVAVAAVVTLVGISKGFETELLKVYEQHGADLVVFRAGVAQRITSSLDMRLAGRIARLPNVESVVPGLMDVVSFEEHDLFGVTVNGWPADSSYFDQMQVVAGRRIEPDDRHAVMLGSVLAKSLNKQVGDEVEVISGQSFTVVGIYQSHNVFENGSLVMALDEMQKLLGREGDITFFMVTAADKDRASVEALRERIKSLTPGLDAMSGRDYADTAIELRLARSAAWLTSAVAFVVGAIGTLNTMVMSVFERVHEIGVLRAVGWRRSRVMRMILGESLLLSLAGAAVGTLVAVAATILLSKMPLYARVVSGEVHLATVAQGVSIAVFVGLFGGLYPAWRAAALLPTEALRHE
ncbi:MAG TPA: ABC transporter permease, partial [Pirellulales bacterium]|nr:ABC transporter permease [Pirellulales bacterium]